MKTYTPDSLIVASRQELVNIILDQALQNKKLAEQNNALSKDNKELISRIDALTNLITELSMQLEWFKRQVFGTKSEKLIPSDDLQMALELGVVNAAEINGEINKTVGGYTRSSKTDEKKPVVGHGRGTMPTHLPVKDVVIEPEEDTTEMVKIGEEVSWYFEMDTPSQLHIVRTTRPKYAAPEKNSVIIGSLPVMPVEKGNAGPGFLAHIVTEKYLYHMPLDRQRRKFKADYNADFSESWLDDNIRNSVFWLESIYNEYKKELLQSGYIQADETPIQVLTKDKKGKSHRGYFWVYHDPIKGNVIFDYRKSRSREGPNDFLKDFKGVLQVDGYEGYSEIITKNNLVHAGCMDHVRRRFEKALEYDKVRCTHALDTMRVWYGLERDARERGLSFDERLGMRKEKIVASMNEFKIWMQKQIGMVLPKSPVGIALQYALNQWQFFTAYQTDGRVELSNILIENAIRPVALGRKNFLFAGSHEAASWPAVAYSLCAIAKNHGVQEFVYFKELLTELPKSRAADIHTYLLPFWKPPTSTM